MNVKDFNKIKELANIERREQRAEELLKNREEEVLNLYGRIRELVLHHRTIDKYYIDKHNSLNRSRKGLLRDIEDLRNERNNIIRKDGGNKNV